MIKFKKPNCFLKSENERKIVLKVTRQGFYFTVLFAVILTLWKLSVLYKTNTFGEHGLVENLQLITLLAATGVFLFSCIKNTVYRPILFLLAALTAFCFVRELDSFFEHLLPVISWKFAYCCPLAALGYAFTKRKNLTKPLFDFLGSSAFDLMFCAMIIFIPLAQCIGHKPFIAQATGSSQNLFLIRRMIEESMELVAYVLIFLSAIELHCGLFKKKD